MPRPEDNILDAIEHMSSQKRPLFAEGVVLSADNGIAEVQIMGSLSRQPAYYNENQNVETGMACVIALLPTRQRYVILNAFNAVGRNMGLSARPADSFELAPPSGLTLNNAIPGFVIATWNAPPQQPVAFQVQTNSVASESGANTFLTTRGSYAIIETSSEIYVRVRSISSTFNTSSWTDWLSSTPVSLSLDASDLDYDPDDDNLWLGSIPDDVEEALDVLASQRLYSTDAETLTIDSGSVTATEGSFFTLESESGSSDNLDKIVLSGTPRIILLQAASGHTITVKHGTDNIFLNGSADFVLSSDKTLALFWDGTNLSDTGAGGGGSSPLTTKGDLFTFGTGNARLPAGLDGQVLAADSGEDVGLKWVNPGSLSGVNVINRGPYASLPGSGSNPGDVYYSTDSPYTFVWTGSVWAARHRDMEMTIPPTSGWSWDNQGSATIDTSAGMHYLFVPRDATSTDFRIRYRTAPTPPYSITAYAIVSWLPMTSGGSYALLFRESSTGRLHVAMLQMTSSGPQIFSTTYTSSTGSPTTYVNRTVSESGIWLRIEDDNTNRRILYSYDGYNFLVFHEVDRTDRLTADQIGFGGQTSQANHDLGISLLSWKEES